ncbi:MAG: hypothetical protein A2297_02630 [Elusimicrobia bacterium RIFOXYB2_FULL_48_7]|nr:MAG: hypothetical protein A2297_02630 [Elusimicrobia bacterium RIFOXYB2_FULL_48_7]
MKTESKKSFTVKIPSRINLKGVHVEHRGGFVNYMAIDKFATMNVESREDDIVEIRNKDSEKFQPRSFSISQELPREKRGNWVEYLAGVKLEQGDWVNYVKAGVLILQDRFKDRELKGMNIIFESNIPIRAGLSSSSSLVVGSAQAACEVNNLPVSKEELAELCGRGEWYVGTRGGAGDHAAMIFGKKGYVMHMQFFPFRVEYVFFPEDYKVVMCNSYVEASKAKGAKDIFNERVATYGMAMLYIKKLFPEKQEKFQYLRDILLEDDPWIYSMLKKLPVKISRDELLKQLLDDNEKLKKLFQSHADPKDGYRVRDICLFGLSECKRGELFIDLLKRRDPIGMGKFMYKSHDGDRVAKFDAQGNKKAWDNSVSDEQLDNLIKTGSPLWMQSGGYRCSCEELDFIVDTASVVPGVIGAGLTGAGLGGCVLVLVKEQNVNDLIKTLEEKYYKPKGLPLGCEVCQPGDGVSLSV